VITTLPGSPAAEAGAFLPIRVMAWQGVTRPLPTGAFRQAIWHCATGRHPVRTLGGNMQTSVATVTGAKTTGQACAVG
jgi:hypothetical protein